MAISLGTARGYGGPLECASCHTAEDNGIGFSEIEMESACESCHSLVYDKVGGSFQSLRHGNIEDIRADLQKIARTPARKKAKPILPGRRRPGYAGSGQRGYPDFGPPASSLVSINMALQPGGVCSECHLPTRTAGKAGVMPVNLPDRFLWHGFFSHAAHEEEECSDCHDAESSGSAKDLLIPGIAVCRDCHEGETALASEVPSSCSMCHAYHTPTKPWRPADPRGGKPPRQSEIAFILDLLRPGS